MSVAEMVDRGLTLRAEIAEREAELKGIEKALRARAEVSEQVPLVDAEREGRQWIARGTRSAVPVVLTSDLLARTLMLNGEQFLAAEAAAAGRLMEFYAPSAAWEIRQPNGVIFRRVAAEVLGERAGEFVSACLRRNKLGHPISTVRVEWDRASEIEQEGAK